MLPVPRRAAEPTIVCAAAVDEPRKRVNLLVEAFALVRRELPEARLVLNRPREPALVAHLGLVPGLELRDLDERADLAAAYREAWVSVLPSTHEPLGLVLVEALACGTPVVGTDAYGIPEVIDRPEVGRLFDGGADELVRALFEAVELTGDPATVDACRRTGLVFLHGAHGGRLRGGLPPTVEGIRGSSAESGRWWSSSASIPAPPTPATAWCWPAGSTLAALDGGVIATGPSEPLERRLARIHARVCDLIAEHRPEALAIEELYFGQNARSAFAVGQARGVVLLAAGHGGHSVLLLHPAGGQAVGLRQRGRGQGPGPAHGRGAALSLPEPPAPDHAADALAVAICHANGSPVRAATQNQAP